MTEKKEKSSRPDLCAAIVTVLLLFVAFPAFADDKAEARKHFEAGLALQKKERYQEAAAEYEESVKLYVTRGGLYNWANTLKALQRFRESLEVFARLKKEYGARLDGEMAADVEKEIAAINRLAARLSIRVDQLGALVRVDGKDLGRSPDLEEAIVPPGRHTVNVELDGFEPASQTVTLVAGSTQSVVFRLRPVGDRGRAPESSDVVPGPDMAATDEAAPGRKKLLSTLGFALTGVGVALLAGGVVTGVMAQKKQNELDDMCDGFACPDNRYVGVQDSRNQLALTTDILLPTGGVLAATGVVLVIIASTRREQGPAGESVVRCAPWIGTGVAGVSYSRTF